VIVITIHCCSAATHCRSTELRFHLLSVQSELYGISQILQRQFVAAKERYNRYSRHLWVEKVEGCVRPSGTIDNCSRRVLQLQTATASDHIPSCAHQKPSLFDETEFCKKCATLLVQQQRQRPTATLGTLC